MPQRDTKSSKRWLKHFLHFVLFCVLLCVCEPVLAASLSGKVIDVSSGDIITISNLNRPVRVKLLGVEAPEMNQAFGEVAKKHLSDLVQDRFVLVEYSGIAADRSLAGKVLLDNNDIGAQMIRDGVAWFDSNNLSRLSESDREMYQQSEQAARSERRGLWQAENPVAPWEFAKAEARNKNQYPTLNAKPTTPRVREGQSVSELTNLTLLKTETNAPRRVPPTNAEIRAAWQSLNSSRKNWHELRPEGQNFSVLVPDQGRQLSYPIPLGDETGEVNMFIAQDGASIFSVFWVSGPRLGETDKVAIQDMVMNGFIKSFHIGYERADRTEFSCPSKREKNISMNGYTGIEFDLSSCSLPTRARAFTRVNGDHRQLIAGIVFYGDDDDNVQRFLNSFIAGSPQKTKTHRH